MPKIKTLPMYDPEQAKYLSPGAKANMQLAEALMGQDMPQRVYSNGTGALLAASKALGGFLAGRAERQAKQEQEEAWNPLRAMVEQSLEETGNPAASGSSGSSSKTFSAPDPSSSRGSSGGSLPLFAQGGVSDYAQAISQIESSGRYDAVGPRHPKYGRALGKYQVMEANVAPWTKAALGRALSPGEFLQSPEAQDAVFEHRFGGYLKQYGNARDAASMWFSGRPLAEAGSRRDSLGTSVPQYVRKFERALPAGSSPSGPAAEEYAQFSAPEGSPMRGRAPLPDAPALPPPDMSPVQAQLRQASALMRHPNQAVREQGWALFQQARQLQQQLLAEHRKMAMDLEKETRQQSHQARMKEYEFDRGDERAELDRMIQQDRLEQTRTEQDRRFKFDQDKFTAEQNKPVIVGGSSRLVDPKTGKEIVPANPAAQNAIEIGPDGSIKVGTGGMKLTEQQSKDVLFHDRALGAEVELQDVEDALRSYRGKYGGQVPVLGNLLKGDAYRQAEVSAKEFLSAVLRKDTGAAVTDHEFELYGGLYLPQPGDDDKTLDIKRSARRRAIRGIKKGLGTATVLADSFPEMFDGTNTLPKATKPGPAAASKPAPKQLSAEEQELWPYLKPDEQERLLKLYGGDK